MTRILLVNVLELCVGLGLLPWLGLTPSPLAYAVGLAAVGIVSAHLALVGVAVGLPALAGLAAVSLVTGFLRRRPGRPSARGAVAALAALAVPAVILAHAARAFAVKPLVEFDGWAIWATRAQGLYDFGGAATALFANAGYPKLEYPLLLPSLQAIDARALGHFDGTLLHLQLLGLAVAFAAGYWTLLRPHAPPLVVAATLAAILAAPAVPGQLSTNYADIPLALFLALGVAALGAWLAADEPGLLAAAAILLAAGALTKNEGELFALAAYVSLAVVARGRRRAVAGAAAATLALVLPWRIWLGVHGITTSDYSLGDAASPSYLSGHAGRVGAAAGELLRQAFDTGRFGLLAPLALVALAAAVMLGRRRQAAFAALWTALSFGGLVVVYWISRNPVTDHLYNSSYRTVASIVVGAAALAPLLARRNGVGPAVPRR